jgi:cyclopropane fatty-acyl-phospholipid synthase-like methyltransferase
MSDKHTGIGRPDLDPSRIVEMASAFYESCTLFAASDVGVFGTLEEKGAASSDALAEGLGLDPRGARLLLDACVAMGLLAKENAAYRNTPASSMFLVPGAPGDLSRAIRYNRDVFALWGRLTEMVQTGEPVEKPEIHLGEDGERTRTFVLAMHGRALGIGRSVVPLLDLSGRRRLLDVGGGPGTYSMLIAKASPDIECTVLDLPGVVAVAAELIGAEGLQNRVKLLPGDYHSASFPGETDIINFFGVLHQESPEAIRELFAKAYAALIPGGIVNVLDMMTDSTRTQPRFSALFALNMALTAEHGWVFSDKDLQQWLEEAGFAHFACKPLPPPMPHWLATAHKPG